MSTVYIWTSSISVSLQKVSMDISRVLLERGLGSEIVKGPSIAVDMINNARAGIIVMPFDPAGCLNYFYIAYELKKNRIPYIYYATIDGKPGLTVPYWVIRELSFTANSNYTKRMIEGSGGRVLDVVYHGVDVEEIQRHRDLRDTWRSKLGVDGYMVLYIATDRPRKCHNLFSRVVKIVSNETDRVQFVVLTEPSAGEYYSDTNAIVVADYGKLSERDYYGLIHASDIYAHGSCSEGFGIPLVEALAAGKPVVHVDYEPLSEITTESTSVRVPYERIVYSRDEGGILFEHKIYNPAEFAKGVLKLVDIVKNLGDRVSSKCVKRAWRFHYRETYGRLLNRLLSNITYR